MAKIQYYLYLKLGNSNTQIYKKLTVYVMSYIRLKSMVKNTDYKF